MKLVTLNNVMIPSHVHFFILEDTLIFQQRMVTTLNDLGFEGIITVANSLAEAYEKLPKTPVNFFLCDYNLPDGKGVELLEKVRSMKMYEEIPFFMVTTVDDVSYIIDAVSKGADGYIVKPWKEQDFVNNLSYGFAKRLKLDAG